MTDWIAVSDHPEVRNKGALAQGVFVMEVALPLTQAAVLIDHQSPVTGGLSIFADPEAGISVLARRGAAMMRLHLPGPLALPPRGIARLRLDWSVAAGEWRLRLDLPGQTGGGEVRGHSTLCPMPDDLAAFSAARGASLRHPAVLWFGVTRGTAPPVQAPWIGPMTPISTPDGLREAEALRAGDLILTADGPRALTAVRRVEVPSRGSFTPVVLRAPYFGAPRDILVSADQTVRLRGPEVEYLFGEDAVLARAADLTDARSAIFDQRRAGATGIVLETAAPEVALAGPCGLGLGHAGAWPLRVLVPYEAVPLLSLLGRGARVRAA